tara:strand:- start:315736 stop:315984 length:249 start_codon:yes stop_codon:yes gene_type:complete
MSQKGLHPATVLYVHALGRGIEERLQNGGAFTAFEAHAIASSITECLTTYPHKVKKSSFEKKLRLKGFATDFVEYVSKGLRL